MTTAGLSAPQLLASSILLARVVVTEHWPNNGGLCPRCLERRCLPWTVARRVLESNSRPPEPILATIGGRS